MKPIVTIDDFNAGVLADSTKKVKNGGRAFVGLDIHKESSVLQVSQALAQETDVFLNLVKWIVYDESDSKYWALDAVGNLYKSASIGGTWSVDSSIGSYGTGMAMYNGSKYYASEAQLKMHGGDTHTLASDTLWHPMCVYLGSLFIGHGRYIAKLEADNLYTQEALTLPVGHRVKSIDVYGDRLVIGTWMGDAITDKAIGYLFTWDGTTTFAEQSYYLEEHGMNALISWENILLNFAGIQGNVYAFNNAFLDKAKQIPNVSPSTGGYAYVNPGAVAQYGGNILAGNTIGSGSALGGVWEFGRKTEDLPFAMSLPYLISTGSTDVQIGAILTGGANKFLVSWEDDGSYGMDALDTTDKATSGYYETQKYEVSDGRHPRLIKGVAITAEPMPTGTSVTVHYKADDASSWTSGGTITSANQANVLFLSFRAKVAQFKFTLISKNNTTPKIKRIEIF